MCSAKVSEETSIADSDFFLGGKCSNVLSIPEAPDLEDLNPRDRDFDIEDVEYGLAEWPDDDFVDDHMDENVIVEGMCSRTKDVVFYPEVTISETSDKVSLASGRGSNIGSDALAHIAGKVPVVGAATSMTVESSSHTASVYLIPDDGDPDNYNSLHITP